jgi:hypothetical protein
MKTKKLIVFVLISFFIFSPFLNSEGWSALRSKAPIMKMETTIVCHDYCAWFGDEYCCSSECCDLATGDCSGGGYNFCISSPLFSFPQK